MTVTLTRMENAMAAFFLGQTTIAARIGRRFRKVASAEWILALENPTGERSPRTGQWADYRRAGRQVGRLLGNRESGAALARWEIRTFGQTIEQAESLQELFLAAIGEGVNEAWSDGTGGPDIDVKGAHWDYSEQTSDYDETLKQAYCAVHLVIPYRSR